MGQISSLKMAQGIPQTKPMGTHEALSMEDIISEITKFLAIYDALAFLQTSSRLYFSTSLWRIILLQAKDCGPLVCSPFNDILSADFAEMRLVGIKTGSLRRNMGSKFPSAVSMRAIPLGLGEKVFSILPGTGVLISSFYDDCKLHLRCWDLRGHAAFSESESPPAISVDDPGPSGQTLLLSAPHFRGHRECLQAFVVQARSKIRLIVLSIEYEDTISLKLKHDIRLNWNFTSPSGFHVQFHGNSLHLMGIPFPTAILGYACIELDSYQKEVALQDVKLAFPLTNTSKVRDRFGYELRGFHLDTNHIVHTFLWSSCSRETYCGSFPTSDPPYFEPLQCYPLDSPPEFKDFRFLYSHFIPDTRRGLLLIGSGYNISEGNFLCRWSFDVSPGTGKLMPRISSADQLEIDPCECEDSSIIHSGSSSNVVASDDYHLIFQSNEKHLQFYSFNRNCPMSDLHWTEHRLELSFTGAETIPSCHYDSTLGILIVTSKRNGRTYRVNYV